jgi:hypothetical protein
MVATALLRDDVKTDWSAYTGCMAGASQIGDLKRMLEKAGFKEIKDCAKGRVAIIHSRVASG